MAYAKDTSVSVDKTEGEIKSLLRKHKAGGIATIESDNFAVITFDMHSRRISFRLPLPDPSDEEFTLTPSRKFARTKDEAYKAWEQACRSRWRGLYLCIRAKLESVETKIETFEEAFLAHVVLPDGSTVGQHTIRAVQLAYDTGNMQPLLPSPSQPQP